MIKSALTAVATAALISGANASDLQLPETPLTKEELRESRGGALLFAGRNFAPFLGGFNQIEVQQDFDLAFAGTLLEVVGLTQIDNETIATANTTELFESISYDPISATFVIDNGGRNNVSLENGFSRSVEIRDYQAVRDIQETAFQLSDFSTSLPSIYNPSSF